MNRRKASDFREYQHGHIDRRSFLNGGGRFALGALTVGAVFEMMRPNYAWAQQVAKVTHPASARVLDRLRTLLKNEGVSNVVPAFRRKLPEALRRLAFNVLAAEDGLGDRPGVIPRKTPLLHRRKLDAEEGVGVSDQLLERARDQPIEPASVVWPDRPAKEAVGRALLALGPPSPRVPSVRLQRRKKA